tara:strand:+ start:162 stop:491 length:330 start_codon:yes stop_codon:yes gene_type:complete
MVDTVSKEPLKQEDVSLKTEKDYKRGVHPNSQANLKPFEKGISGNPSGRPQKYEGLKRALEPYGDNFSTAWKRSDWTKKEVVLETIWQKAEEGSIPHITILANLGLLDD